MLNPIRFDKKKPSLYVINEQLEWAPGLYLTGPYADLIIGPFARAVYGGQEAARRILPELLAKPKSV